VNERLRFVARLLEGEKSVRHSRESACVNTSAPSPRRSHSECRWNSILCPQVLQYLSNTAAPQLEQ